MGVLLLFLIGGVFFFSDVFASTSGMTVQSCSIVSGSGTITNCAGLNTSDNNTDVSLTKNSILGTTMSDPSLSGPVNFIQATIRHGGQSGISGNVGITFWDSNSSSAFCTEINVANSVSFVTDTVTACTPAGGWTQTKLNNLQLRIKNKDTGGSSNLFLSYDTVNVDFNGPVCGNNVVETGETCDPPGSNQACTTSGGYAGSQSCNSTCTGYTTCTSTQFCGDHIVNGPETCDGGSQSCTTGGGYSGSQSCNGSCSGWNTCTSGQFCGDGIKNGPELCDGNDLGGALCTDFNFSGGTLHCRGTCLAFDFNACI